MPNGSRSRAARRGEPGLIPRRGAAALLVTGGGLLLLLSFRAPEADLFSGDGPLLAPDDPGGVALLMSPGPPSPAVPAPSEAPEATAPPVVPPTPRVVLGPPAPSDLPGRAPDPTRRPATTPPAPDPTADAPATPDASAPTRVATPTPAVARQVVDGKVVRTPYGDVQVEVTLKGGKLVDIQALLLPDGDRHSRRISEIVAPMLHDDALQVGSARIHGVSGATYTSMGYARSLQSALDQAGA